MFVECVCTYFALQRYLRHYIYIIVVVVSLECKNILCEKFQMIDVFMTAADMI